MTSRGGFMIGMRPRPAARRMAVLTAGAVTAGLLALPQGAAYASATPTLSSVPSVTHVGAVLSVSGTGLDDVSSLKINGAALTGLTMDATHVSGTVPSGATTGLLTLTTSSGGAVSSSDSVTVAPPPVVSGLTSSVGDRAAIISWSSAGTGLTIVRDVTGVSGPLTPASGRGIAVSGNQARDTAFTNESSAVYAVWARDADGTVSDAPSQTTTDPQPAVPTTLTLNTNFASGTYPFTLGLTGQLTRLSAAVPNQSLEVWSSVVGSPETLLRTVTTAWNGTFRTLLVPNRSRTYTVRFPGNAFSSSSVSPTRTVTVLGRVSAAFSPTSILRGQSSVLSGRTLPGVGSLVLTIQRRSGTSWVTYARTRTAADGSYRIALSPGLGLSVMRVLRPAVPGLALAYSPWALLRVEPRDMSDGMSGPDVLALQRKLASLHYDPGPLDGYYSYSTHHAVMTFQKVELLPVTGIWRTAERTRVTHPHAWRVRYPSSGLAVEIDITRQVLVLSYGGAVRRILDVSTGSEKTYYQDGQANVAHTPRGRYSVYYKIDGIRISKLGELYKPSYFYRGYAIHGSPSVPAYPASHGCVRITNPNADRLFPLLTYHTPVTVYHE